jgi:hypothetical protein
VDHVKSRNARLIVTLVAGITALAVAGPFASSAAGATKYSFRFVTQPADAEIAPATITSTDFVAGSNFVQVELVEQVGVEFVRVTNVKQTVTFTLGAASNLEPDEGAATGNLNVTPQPLVDGVAEFGTGTLSIGTLNEPQFTSYGLVPRNTKGPLITGPASTSFDIFQDGDTCSDTCEALIRSGNESYATLTGGTLGASQIAASNLTGFVNACETLGQKEIFANSVFVHETTDTTNPGSPGPVFHSSHITRADMKAAANNGQAHITWCVATEDEQPWLDNGGTHLPDPVDTNGAAPGGGPLFVGTAPSCPQANPSSFAPCIVSQNGDGNGGSITTGWLLGGDPPKRS